MSQKEKFLITNGVFPIEFNLQFENKLIDITEAIHVSKIGDWECKEIEIRKLIAEVNSQISDSFRMAFEPLVIDLKSKDRSERGVLAAAGVQLGLAVADKLVGKAVDFLFDSRRKKTEYAVTELQASLHTIQNDFKLSALELCTFGKKLLQEKINRIALELSLSIENQIKNEIQKLYFGELNNKYKLSACLALNEHASKYDCLKIIRSNEFLFNILEIDLESEKANIQLQILTPILSKIIFGQRIFNLGIPMIHENTNILVKGLIPDFLTSKTEYTFLQRPAHQVIDESLLVSNPKIDRDCLVNTTDSDQKCDALVEVTTAKYLIKHIKGYTVLINFIECSYTNLDTLDEPQFLSVGTHIVTFDLGFLTCAEERLSFSHKSLHYRKHISYSNYKTEFNLIERDMFLNTHNKNILDEDHVLEQLSIFPSISLRDIIIVILLCFIICVIVSTLCFYNKIKNLYQRCMPPALVY